MKVIGLTGGIATGKSTAAKLLRYEFSAPVIDADRLAREVVAPGKPTLAKIVEKFGKDVLLADGTLDRAKMRALIVADADARHALEAITHPAIQEAMLRKLSSMAMEGAPVAVIEAALMVETGSYLVYEAVIVVGCSPETQLKRLIARDNCTEADARAMIGTQLPIAEKEKHGTYVIHNDGTTDELKAAIMKIWADIMPPRSS